MRQGAPLPASPKGRRGASRARVPAVALLVAVLLPSPPLRADRRDQKAADLYTEAVALVKKGRYPEAAERLNRALERGATEPNEMQGTETRYLAKRYDPYYWLGVAQMEMGLTEQALANLEKSETYGLVKKWPQEWADLSRRKSLLLAKLSPSPAPSPVAAVAAAAEPATAAATPVLVAAPPPTSTPVTVRLPSPAAEPVASGERRPALPPSAAEVLAEALGALGAGRLGEAERRAADAAVLDPHSPRPDVLRACVLGTRYVLDGEKDPALLERAREALAAWRRKAGPGRPLPPLLSPALRLLLAATPGPARPAAPPPAAE